MALHKTTFKIESTLDGTIFTAYFADGAPIVTEGYAGWQVINRPKNLGITEWQGRNPLAIEIPFLIDFWLEQDDDTPGISCEAEVTHLERLAGVGVGVNNEQPPVCIVRSGGLIPYDHKNWPNGRWVIENISWDRGIEQRSAYSGRRLRCGGTITIRQFVVARSLLRKIGPKSRAKVPKVYIVKKGDTLSKIANWFYKDPNKWKIIADANQMRDRRKLKVGQRLKIPAI